MPHCLITRSNPAETCGMLHVHASEVARCSIVKIMPAWLLALVFSALVLGASPHTTPREAASNEDPGLVRMSGYSDSPRFDRLTIDDGLSIGVVYSILQDRQGFMWFGTQDGLNRFDGYSFRVYRFDPDDPNSLSHNEIRAMVEGRDGVLWIATWGGGLNRFNPDTETFTRYGHDPSDPGSIGHDYVRGLHESEDGTLWIGTIGGGLARYDDESESFVHFRHDRDDPQSIGGDCVRDIFEDSRGRLWLGLEVCAGQGHGGLDLFDPTTGTFTHFRHDPSDPATLSSDRIRGIWEGPDGMLWIGTWGGGLDRFDPETGHVQHHRHDPRNPRSLASDNLWHLAGHDSTLWVSTMDGLLRFDLGSESFTRYRHDPRDPNSLSANAVFASYEDHSGALWVATTDGISFVDWHRTVFKHLKHHPDDSNTIGSPYVWASRESRIEPGVIWFGTSAGITRYDRRNEQFSNFPVPVQGWTGTLSEVFSLEEASDGTLLAGTPGGIRFINPSTGRTDQLPHFAAPLADVSIRTIYRSDDDIFWIGTYGTLYRLDLRKSTLEPFQIREEGPILYNEVNYQSILEGEDGMLWIGTEDGLYHFDPRTGDHVVYRHESGDPFSIGSERINDLILGGPGELWIATSKGGLNRLDVASGRFKRYTMQNSALPANTIYDLLRDSSGHLWLSTTRGLAHFDPDAQTFQTFGLERGAQAWDFNAGSASMTSAGEFVFGGVNGVNIFHPDDIEVDPVPPRVVLVDLRVAGKRVVPGGRTLPVRISDARQIQLGHRRNNVTLEYVGLHYSAPSKNRYQYKLEGYDQDWVDAGEQRSATYTNLDPGRYTFSVMAANADGVWSGVTSVDIVILPPWWRTGWAYAVYALLLVGGFIVTDRTRRRQVQREEREQALLREKDLRAEAAEAHLRALRAENERQMQELEAARSLQLSMLPRCMPSHPHVEVCAHMQTAAEVGGDYYDWHHGDDGTLTIAIGDATGHGARAGTMVTAAKSLFTHGAHQQDLGAFLADASRTIRAMGLERLYLAFALVRIREEGVELAGAGMPSALIYRVETGEVEQIPLKGLPLGAPAEAEYHTYHTRLEPGDIMLLMSDGMAELFDANGNMFGYDEVRDAFMDHAPGRAIDVVDRLFELASRHTGGRAPNDDITLVAIRANPVPEMFSLPLANTLG